MTTFRTPILAAASLLALAACDDPTRFQRGGDLERTGKGAAGGAVLGAIVGGLADGGDGAVKGAVLGGAAGAVVGNILDKQAAELRNNLGNEVGVINTGSELIVRMPQDLLFATDSATLRPNLRSDLVTLSNSLLRYPNSIVTVVGHTDNTGSASYNQTLSENRANSVASVLIQSGVPAGRIRVVGAGENQPIASNLTPEGRQQNRRVDITITPTR